MKLQDGHGNPSSPIRSPNRSTPHARDIRSNGKRSKPKATHERRFKDVTGFRGQRSAGQAPHCARKDAHRILENGSSGMGEIAMPVSRDAHIMRGAKLVVDQ
eukprot:6354896-Alexandrium_andersonii.AAC.1